VYDLVHARLLKAMLAPMARQNHRYPDRPHHHPHETKSLAGIILCLSTGAAFNLKFVFTGPNRLR
jgi:hypothetical protein